MMHEVELSHSQENARIPGEKLERRDDEVAEDGRDAEDGDFGVPLGERRKTRLDQLALAQRLLSSLPTRFRFSLEVSNSPHSTPPS